MHQSVVTIFPSITPAATTSIVTGAYPAEHGISGASWYDEARQEVAYYGDDFWVIAKQGFGAFLRDFLVRLNGDRLTAPTLFEMVESAGVRAASLNYLVFRGNTTHRVRVPLRLAVLPGAPLTEQVSGPSTLCLGDFVRCGPAHRRKRGLLDRFGMDDGSTGRLLNAMAADRSLPDLTVAYFADNDFRSHEVGPTAALGVIERVDATLGAAIAAAGGFDRFLSDTCVIVMSDHGHCELLADKDKAVVRLDRALGDFRQADIGRGWRARDDVMICPNMRAAQLYLQEPSAERVERVVAAAVAYPGVDQALWRAAVTEPGAPGYMVATARGRLHFWRSRPGPEGPGYPRLLSGPEGPGYPRLPSGDRGASERGRDAFGTTWNWTGDSAAVDLARDGDAIAFPDYPNAFERIANVLDLDKSGDVWLTANPGSEFEVPGGAAHVGGASHGALHALDSLCPVVIAGPGVPAKLPRDMRTVDIAPLCMELLGLPMRYRVGEARGGMVG